MSNEIKEKEEYEKYARDHRKELDAQEVKLGDVVKVLVGQFAGKKGVIVGMIACDKSDYADPYYEIEMECDVPEEFRVRKTLIGQSRVIGGVEKRYLKVMGNRAPKQPSMEIKKGDKVRVSSRLPRIYERFGSMIAPHYECKVVEIDDGMALLDSIPAKHIFLFPLKYLVKVDAEAKEPKFKVNDVVRTVFNETTHITSVLENGNYYLYGMGNEYPEDSLTLIQPYIKPTTPTIKVGDRVRTKSGVISVVERFSERFGKMYAILNDCDALDCLAHPIDELKLIQPKEPSIKVGDKVIVKQDVEMSKKFSIFKRKFSIVKRIDNDKATLEINRMKHCDLELMDVPLECIEKVDAIEYLHGHRWTAKQQTEAEKTFDNQIRDVLNGVEHKDYGHPIQAVMANLDRVLHGCDSFVSIKERLRKAYTDTFDWDAYTADLAKDVALKVVNKYDNPTEAAECAMQVAKAVVEGLKRK